MSVVFDFSDSLNDVAPVLPVLLPGHVKRKWKEWIVDECLLCFLSFVFTTHIEFSECCVWLQWFTQWCCSHFSNIVPCLRNEKKVNCWWMSFVYLLSSVSTAHIELSKCCVWFQWFTQWCCSCVSNVVPCLRNMKGKGRMVDGCLSCIPFFCLHHQDKDLWVLCLILMLDSMILLLRLQCRCLFIWREMKRVTVDGGVFCVFFLLFSHPRLSFVSVVFDLNASLNDFAPVSPISFPVDVNRMETID